MFGTLLWFGAVAQLAVGANDAGSESEKPAAKKPTYSMNAADYPADVPTEAAELISELAEELPIETRLERIERLLHALREEPADEAVQAVAEELPLPEPSSEPAVPLTPELEKLRTQIRQCLATYEQRPVNARDHSPWEIMHWLIAYNVNAKIRAGGPWGKEESAVGWLCWNRPSQGMEMLTLDRGRLSAKLGPGVQGHEGQFLAILAQSRLKREYPIKVRGQMFTIDDLIETEKRSCRPGTELTFKLIGLMDYLDSDATWENNL